MFGESAYLFAIIKYFSFAFFPFIPFAMQLFSNPVTSSNLRNQAPLFTELRFLQGTAWYSIKTVRFMIIKQGQWDCQYVVTGLPDWLFWCQISQIWLFLEVVSVKKIVWLFGFFFFNVWLFLQAVRTCYQTAVSWLFKDLSESVISLS